MIDCDKVGLNNGPFRVKLDAYGSSGWKQIMAWVGKAFGDGEMN